MSDLREMSVESLEVAYNRLGIKFDHFDGESMYGGRASDKVILSCITLRVSSMSLSISITSLTRVFVNISIILN